MGKDQVRRRGAMSINRKDVQTASCSCLMTGLQLHIDKYLSPVLGNMFMFLCLQTRSFSPSCLPHCVLT